MTNSQKCWAFGLTQYVRAAVDNVEEYLGTKGAETSPQGNDSFIKQVFPEVDISDELDEDEASYFQSLIGVLRWIVELGRIEICCELSMLSSHLGC